MGWVSGTINKYKCQKRKIHHTFLSLSLSPSQVHQPIKLFPFFHHPPHFLFNPNTFISLCYCSSSTIPSCSPQDPSMTTTIWSSLPPIWSCACPLFHLWCRLLFKASRIRPITIEAKVSSARKPYNSKQSTQHTLKKIYPCQKCEFFS